MAVQSAKFGLILPGLTPWGDASVLTGPSTVPLFIDGEFQLKLVNPNGQLIAIIEDWLTGKRSLTLNKPEQLEVTVPIESLNATNLKTFSNQLWLYDNTGAIIEKYVLDNYEENSNYDLVLHYISLLGQLAYGRVSGRIKRDQEAYKTIQEILANYQGSIHTPFYFSKSLSDSWLYNQTVTIDITHKNLLDILYTLLGEVGGIMYVDPASIYGDRPYLVWKAQIPQTQPIEIRWNKNMSSINVKTFPGEVRNYITGYGKNLDGVEIQANVNDGASIATYGTMRLIVRDDKRWTTTQLTNWITPMLQKMANPPVDINVGVLDLTKAETKLDYSHTELELGKLVRLIHPEIGIQSSDHVILGITQSLKESLSIGLTLGRSGEGPNENKKDSFIRSVAKLSKEVYGKGILEEDKFKDTHFIEDFADVDDLLETDEHPNDTWANGERVISGAGTEGDPHEERVYDSSTPEWVQVNQYPQTISGAGYIRLWTATTKANLPAYNATTGPLNGDMGYDTNNEYMYRMIGETWEPDSVLES
jgi:hypothetical protein